jgi:transcriptional regulator with XRE-family HTH domain
MITPVGKRIMAVMAHFGLKQASLAATIGLAQSAISMYASGQREMSQQVAMAFQAALGIRWQWLLYGEGSMLLDSVTAHMPEDLKQIADLWPRLTEKQRQYVLGVVQGILAAGERK